MPVQLFSLRGVPEDEAEEIRQLLKDHKIAYYETPAGNWGISIPAFWLRDELQLTTAKSLIDDYQQQRLQDARADYQQQKREGKLRTFFDELKSQPIKVIVYVAIGVCQHSCRLDLHSLI